MIIKKIKIKEIDELEIICKIGLFLERYTFHRHIRDTIIPEFKGGVYILYEKGNVVRVGQSADVGYRLASHNRKTHSTNKVLLSTEWDAFSIIPCGNKYERFMIEATYIETYKPKYNTKLSSAV